LKGRPIEKYLGTHCGELSKYDRTDRDAVWVVDSGGPKEACIKWCAD